MKNKQMKKLTLGVVLLTLSLSSVACGKKADEAYKKGLAEASTAFNITGNTELDEEKTKGNLGLAAEQRKKEESKSVPQQASQAINEAISNTGGEAKAHTLAINTETYLIHDINCEEVDLKRATFRTWDGTIEDAEAKGYSRHALCLGVSPK